MPGDDTETSGPDSYSEAIFRGPQRLPNLRRQDPPPGVPDDVARVPDTSKEPEPGREEDGRNIARLVPAMDARLPDGMAELYAYPMASAEDGTRRFGLLAACCCEPARFISICDEPDVDLARNARDGQDSKLPDQILLDIQYWSQQRGNLTRWLDDCREKHWDRANGHDALELVIWDDTKLRIPWELFWIDPRLESKRFSGWLGALMTVTRWVTMELAYPEDLKSFLSPGPRRGRGSIAAYIKPRMAADAAVLQGFHFDVEHATSMDELFQESLDDAAKALGVVYVACHGTFGSRPQDSSLDGFSVQRATMLGIRGLRRLRKHPAVVFLNACNSAFLGVDFDKYDDVAMTGFVEVFLQAGAAGVLATTGAVGEDVARSVVTDLFGHISRDDGRSLAAAVRQLRAKAADAILSDPALLDTKQPPATREKENKRLLVLLYIFMYVYFGSPRAVISVTRRTAAGTGELTEAGEPS
jgi:hypothetical protein